MARRSASTPPATRDSGRYFSESGLVILTVSFVESDPNPDIRQWCAIPVLPNEARPYVALLSKLSVSRARLPASRCL